MRIDCGTVNHKLDVKGAFGRVDSCKSLVPGPRHLMDMDKILDFEGAQGGLENWIGNQDGAQIFQLNRVAAC